VPAGILLLIILLGAGLYIHNQPLAAAALLLLIVSTVNWPVALHFLERHSVQLGIFFLLVAVLTPFTQGALTWTQVYSSLISGRGILVVTIGALSTYLAARGVRLLQGDPVIMVSLVVGSVLGVSLLGGIPAGPLVAAGLAAVLVELLAR